MEYKDYYKTLGVSKTASASDIKRAYRKLAREHHPDRHSGDKKAEDRIKEINEAYEVLGDPEKRRKYDQLLLKRFVQISGSLGTFDSRKSQSNREIIDVQN